MFCSLNTLFIPWHLAVRSGEHIGILLITNERVQPRKDSDVTIHPPLKVLVFCATSIRSIF